MVRDSSLKYSKLSNILEMPHFFKGVRPQNLTNSAFETGIQTGLINELSFEQIQLTNNTYTLQNDYEQFSTLMLSGLVTMDVDDNELKKVFRFLSMSMTDIAIKEQELLIEYDKLLTELNGE